jgi:hypothetical protein
MCFVSTCNNPWPHLHIMPIAEILGLDTCEIRSEEWEHWYLEYKRDYQYDCLKRSVTEHGFQPGFAPEIIEGIINEGHHRITLMYDLSGYWCPWQDIRNYDQWNDDWEHYVYSTTAVTVDA